MAPYYVRYGTFARNNRTDYVGGDLFTQNIRDMSGMTPGEFFTLFEENTGLFPGYIGELTKDREDIGHYYNLTFAELRAGETKSPRIFQIREY